MEKKLFCGTSHSHLILVTVYEEAVAFIFLYKNQTLRRSYRQHLHDLHDLLPTSQQEISRFLEAPPHVVPRNKTQQDTLLPNL